MAKPGHGYPQVVPRAEDLMHPRVVMVPPRWSVDRALAGSVLGSNVAAHGRRTEGAVLGGVVGAGVGAAVGHANDKHRCDQRGAYWTYNDTVPYRVNNDVYRDDRYADYSRRGCRLAPAPVSDNDYRYVRVCPDSEGRYRVTG